MSGNPSAITDSLSVDSPLVQSANYRFNQDDRQYLDNQVRGIEQHLVDALIRGRHATYIRLNPSAGDVVPGDVLCLDAIDNAECQAVKATSGNIADAGGAFGIVLRPAGAGSWACVAIKGALPRSITGLPTDAHGAVRVNTTTARAERVTSISSGDYVLGTVSNGGSLTLGTGLGGGGGGGSVDAENIGYNDGPVGEVYAGKDGETLQFRRIRGTGRAQVSTTGDLIEVFVEETEENVISAASVGDGQPVYAGTVSNEIRIRSIKGTGVANVTTAGGVLEINVPSSEVGAVEGENIGDGPAELYKGLGGGGELQIRTLEGTGAADVTQVGDKVVIHVEPSEGGGSPVTFGGVAGDAMVKVDAVTLTGVGGTENDILRRVGGQWVPQPGTEVPEGDENDVVGLTADGRLKSLGPMPSGGGGGGGSDITLGGATGQILYKNGTDSIGGTSWTYALNAFIAGVLGYITFGLTNLASKGKLRLSNALGAIIAQRDPSNTSDEVLLAADEGGRAYLFSNAGISDPVPNGYVFPRDTLRLGLVRDVFLRLFNTSIEQWAPLIGGGGKPYGTNGEVYIGATTEKVASANDLAKYFWKFSTSGSTTAYDLLYHVPLPTTFNEAYSKFIWIPSGGKVRFTCGAGVMAIVDASSGAGPQTGILMVSTDGCFWTGGSATGND